MPNNTKKRFPLIDEIRALAIILMIIFHLFYDLNIFGFVEIDFLKEKFWLFFPRVIVFLFMLSVGFSLAVAHLPKIKWKIFWFRFGKIAIFAAIISLMTFFLFPTAWIYFGTLHCIALCSILCLPFINRPNIALIIALALIIPSAIFDINIPWFLMIHSSMDYIPPFPWLGVSLLGIFAYHHNIHHFDLSKYLGPSGKKPLKFFHFLGRHSLLIYIIHQPILYSCIFLLKKLTT